MSENKNRIKLVLLLIQILFVLVLTCCNKSSSDTLESNFIPYEETESRVQIDTAKVVETYASDYYYIATNSKASAPEEFIEKKNLSNEILDDIVKNDLRLYNNYDYVELKDNEYLAYTTIPINPENWQLEEVFYKTINNNEYEKKHLLYHTNCYKLGNTAYKIFLPLNFEKENINREKNNEEIENSLVAAFNNNDKILQTKVKKVLIYHIPRINSTPESYVRYLIHGAFGDYIMASFKGKLASTYRHKVVYDDIEYKTEEFVLSDDYHIVRIAFCYENEEDIDGFGFGVMNSLLT